LLAQALLVVAKVASMAPPLAAGYAAPAMSIVFNIFGVIAFRFIWNRYSRGAEPFIASLILGNHVQNVQAVKVCGLMQAAFSDATWQQAAMTLLAGCVFELSKRMQLIQTAKATLQGRQFVVDPYADELVHCHMVYGYQPIAAGFAWTIYMTGHLHITQWEPWASGVWWKFGPLLACQLACQIFCDVVMVAFQNRLILSQDGTQETWSETLARMMRPGGHRYLRNRFSRVAAKNKESAAAAMPQAAVAAATPGSVAPAAAAEVADEAPAAQDVPEAPAAPEAPEAAGAPKPPVGVAAWFSDNRIYASYLVSICLGIMWAGMNGIITGMTDASLREGPIQPYDGGVF